MSDSNDKAEAETAVDVRDKIMLLAEDAIVTAALVGGSGVTEQALMLLSPDECRISLNKPILAALERLMRHNRYQDAASVLSEMVEDRDAGGADVVIASCVIRKTRPYEIASLLIRLAEIVLGRPRDFSKCWPDGPPSRS